MLGLTIILIASLYGQVTAECNGKPVHAACFIEPGKESNVSGTIDFRQKMTFGCFASGGMEVLLDLKGFSTGDSVINHGIQVKTYGDTSHGCATTGYTYSADDGHGIQMLGDLGTLQEDTQGTIYTMIRNKKSKLSGPLSIVGRAVVVYDGAFNPFSQNPINAPILGCCVIGYSDGSRWTASRNAAVITGAALPIKTGMRSGIHQVVPQHPTAPHTANSFHQPQSFQHQHPAMSTYHSPQVHEFGNDFGLGGHDIFGGSMMSHHKPMFSFGGSSHSQAHDRFNHGGSLGPHIPDFDKAQSTPIYKRKESDIRSPLFGEDPKPLFDNSHSSFFPSFDQDASFKNEKDDVIHSKDRDDDQENESNGQYSDSDGQYADSDRQGASYDDGHYGHQHGRSEYDQGSDRASSDTGEYDNSDSSDYKGDNSASDDGSTSSSSSSSDGSYSAQSEGSSNDSGDDQNDYEGDNQSQYQDQQDDQDSSDQTEEQEGEYQGKEEAATDDNSGNVSNVETNVKSSDDEAADSKPGTRQPVSVPDTNEADIQTDDGSSGVQANSPAEGLPQVSPQGKDNESLPSEVEQNRAGTIENGAPDATDLHADHQIHKTLANVAADSTHDHDQVPLEKRIGSKLDLEPKDIPNNVHDEQTQKPTGV